jgi:hypothetical protein
LLTGCGDGSTGPRNGSGANPFRLPLERLNAVLFDLAIVSERTRPAAAQAPAEEAVLAEAMSVLESLRRSGMSSGVIGRPADGFGIGQWADLVLNGQEVAARLPEPGGPAARGTAARFTGRGSRRCRPPAAAGSGRECR